MNRKQIQNYRISGISEKAPDYYLLRLVPTEGSLPEIRPGQFVNVEVPASRTTFLRRPISVNFVDREAGELWMMVKAVGDGTRSLCSMKEGDILNLVLPLGNGFDLGELGDGDNVLLVGGGVGAAPLLYLAFELVKRGIKPTLIYGAKTGAEFAQLDEFEVYTDLKLTTDDGSRGKKGVVTMHESFSDTLYKRVFCCGPLPMMKAVGAKARELGIDCQVSLENKMACGIGACLCCVEDTKEGHKCVCTDGPVFNINDLKW